MTKQINLDKAAEAIRTDFPLYSETFLRIPNKRGELVPFTLNRVQRKLWRDIKRRIDKGKPVRMIILKARQMGVSTFIQGLMHWHITLNPNRNGLTVAHDFDASQNLNKMQNVFYKHSPIKPDVKSWSRSLIEFDSDKYSKTPGLQSRILIDTAANANLGRSYTIHNFHGSEVAAWEKISEGFGGVRGVFAALNQSIPDLPGTFKFLESTAQGEGYFKELWDVDESYDKVFLSWVAFDEYRTETDDRWDLSDVEDSQYGDETIEFARIRKEVKVWYPELITEDQVDHEIWCRLKWRRDKITRDCERDVGIFRQEFPSTPEDAFAASGVGIFDQFRLAERLRAVNPDPKDQNVPLAVPHQRMRFNVNSSVNADSNAAWWQYAMQKSPYGEVFIFEDPNPNAIYVIGADSSYGTDQDYSAAVVLRVPENVEVATANLHLDADSFGDLLYVLGMAYGKALLGVEVDGPGLSTIHRLERLRYPKLYWMKELNRVDKPVQLRHGWHMNASTKPLMVNTMRGLIRDGAISLNHPETIRQLKAFRQVQGRRSGDSSAKRFEAATGFHDDLVIAACIAVMMGTQTHIPLKSGGGGGVDPMRTWRYWVDKYKSNYNNGWLPNA